MEEIKTEELLCPVCYTKLGENDNFCHSCGEAVSDLAKDFKSDEKTNIELALLVKLMDYMKDEKDIKFLNGLIKKLSED